MALKSSYNATRGLALSLLSLGFVSQTLESKAQDAFSINISKVENPRAMKIDVPVTQIGMTYTLEQKTNLIPNGNVGHYWIPVASQYSASTNALSFLVPYNDSQSFYRVGASNTVSNINLNKLKP